MFISITIHSHLIHCCLLQEAATKEFEDKKRQWEEEANAKTSKNRAKRLKKKERSKTKPARDEDDDSLNTPDTRRPDAPLKKRRLVNGAEVIFQKPRGEDEDCSSADDEGPGPTPLQVPEPQDPSSFAPDISQVPVIDSPKIVIHDD